MMRSVVQALPLAAAALCSAPALAAPALDAGFGDNMVLQSGAPLTLSGRSEPGAQVTVVLGGESLSVKAAADGRFIATLPAQGPSTRPTSLTIRDTSGAVTYGNILLGNVFLCGG